MAKRPPRNRRDAPSYAESPYLVFVSHATADKWIATVLCEKIEQTGVKTFRDDRDIAGGDDIPEEIRRKIKEADELVVLLTPESFNRQWVLVEIGAAWGQRRKAKIVPVLCHVGVDKIPEVIRWKKAVPLNELAAYLADLTGRAQRGRL